MTEPSVRFATLEDRYLGALFGVRHSTIGYIVRRETWAWLEDSA